MTVQVVQSVPAALAAEGNSVSLKITITFKRDPLKEEAAANPNASTAQNCFWSWGCQSCVLPLTMV